MNPTAILEANPWLQHPFVFATVQFVVTVAMFIVAAVGVVSFGERTARRVVRHTETQFDDILLDRLLGPIAATLVLMGFWYGAVAYDLGPRVSHLLAASLKSVAVLMWGTAAYRMGSELLEYGAQVKATQRILQMRTLPLFDTAWKTFVLAGSAYFLMVGWGLDPTAWLASAGIVGVAVGFAAQTTLTDLFGGVVLMADGPFRLGDYLRLPDGTRGRVVDIGLRSTRIRTLNDTLVVVPNAQMAASTVVNESGGPDGRERVGVEVSVAYDTNLRQAEKVLLQAATRVEELVQDDVRVRPLVRFSTFGDHGISAHLYGWVRHPSLYELAKHNLVLEIHEALGAQGIEIPFPQLDLHHDPVVVRQVPEAGEG